MRQEDAKFFCLPEILYYIRAEMQLFELKLHRMIYSMIIIIAQI